MFYTLMEQVYSLVHGEQVSGFDKLVEQIKEAYDDGYIAGSQHYKLMGEIQDYL